MRDLGWWVAGGELVLFALWWWWASRSRSRAADREAVRRVVHELWVRRGEWVSGSTLARICHPASYVEVMRKLRDQGMVEASRPAGLLYQLTAKGDQAGSRSFLLNDEEKEILREVDRIFGFGVNGGEARQEMAVVLAVSKKGEGA